MSSIKFRKSRVRSARFKWPDKWLEAVLSLSGFYNVSELQHAESIKYLSDHFLHSDNYARKRLTNSRQHGRGHSFLYGSDIFLQSAYAGYYLPANVPKVIDSFLCSGIDWKTVNRIIDIGTGPGTAMLGSMIARHLSGIRSPLFLTGMDHSTGFMTLARKLIQSFRTTLDLPGNDSFLTVNLEQLIRDERFLNQFAWNTDAAQKKEQTPLPDFNVSAMEFDLLTASNIVAELSENARKQFDGLVNQCVRPGGYALLVEPARRQPARCLAEIRNRMISLGWSVLYPCPGNYSCPMLHRKRDWCHHRLTWNAPTQVAEIDHLTGMKKSCLNFSVFILQKQSCSVSHTAACADDTPSGNRPGTVEHINEPVGSTAPLICRVVSDVIRHKGRFEVYLCGHFNHEKHLMVAVLEKKHLSDYNTGFMGLARYDRIRLENSVLQGERLIIQKKSRLTILVDDGDRE
jgi:ribosomal protein RSM22 (predicted rRNA methylase)